MIAYLQGEKEREGKIMFSQLKQRVKIKNKKLSTNKHQAVSTKTIAKTIKIYLQLFQDHCHFLKFLDYPQLNTNHLIPW